MKKAKGLKQSHTSNSKIGMGDFYGSGIRNPVARIRESYITPNLSKNQLKKPPKSLA